MAVDVSLKHVTHYSYDRSVKLGPQTIRLRPAPHTRSSFKQYSLQIFPKKHFINWQQDPFGNYLAGVVFEEPTSEFRVEVGLITEIRVFNPFAFFLDDEAEFFPLSYAKERKDQLGPYIVKPDDGPLFKKFIKKIDIKKQKTMDFLVRVNQLVYKELNYLVRMEPGVQTSEQTLQLGQGSCRDFAWLLCQVLRKFGLASRFVSGYLIQLKPDIKSSTGPNGPEEDFTDLHAWTEVYLEGAGWIGLDATSGLLAGEGHIPLCCTPSPLDAAPISGLIDPCEAKLEHTMTVDRIHEAKRITKPYTQNQWENINHLGELVDKHLDEQDVRLTMGGEPTFVPADNRESEEWAGKALGAAKYEAANRFIRKLQKKFAPGAVIQFSQGKWYPGEPLPRWAQSCYWRRDGEHIFDSTDWIAASAETRSFNLADGKTLIEKICDKLGLDNKHVLPAYEDRVYHLWQNRALPDVIGDEPDAEQNRPETVTKLNLLLNEPSGFVLPLLFSSRLKRWISSPWNFKDDKLVLTPGDSPLGLRLPLGSLPYNSAGESEIWPERDPFATHEKLPKRKDLLDVIEHRERTKNRVLPDDTQTNAFVKLALSIDVKHGMISVFLPPTSYLEHYLDLVTSIESAVSDIKLSVHLCGYPPPKDERLLSFSLTPDPGVIEVNAQPTSSWEEQKELTQDIYAAAHENGLSASRFFLDGRRVGTGGGNHIVLGARKAEDSPFLRNPGLLRSMLTFWQHHPSLSYLFACEFIGPTSQAPRIDEARNDSLYELEIAFQQLEKEEECPPWLVDRLFRNLLIDSTGNTHRSEFCIDKMFSPQGTAGRLGLLELRGFEMPPHPQMALLQSLLVRACIAKFWKHPYHEKLISWGTRLHDKFLLPSFLWEDLGQVLEHLKFANAGFDVEWFQAFLDFRCPIWGTTEVGSMKLQLRHALEPWHVMGEDIYQGSISRAVDSSVERIEVNIKGFDERYALICNGKRVPLSRTNDGETWVAGVRYKAWNPPSGLHPRLPINSPLTFDLVNLSDERSLGGCTYHVVHPGGQNYQDVPINENEAEARCRSRFEPMGFTTGRVKVSALKPNPNFPYTLDLRYC